MMKGKKRKMKYSIGSRAFDAFNVIFMIILGMVMAYPFLSVIAMSISDNDSLLSGKVTIIPKGLNFNAYRLVFADPLVGGAYLNTVVYAFGGTILMLLVTSLAAYPLTFNEFKAKKLITILYTITMFFSGGLIPTYLWMRQLHLLNTLWVMIVPGCVGAYNVFVFRTFFSGIDKGLREAAYIDGASDMAVLFRIILPLSQALLATFALFSIVGAWNSWFNALIYLNDERKYPIQLVLRRYIMNPPREGNISATMSSQALWNMMRAYNINPKAVQMALIVSAMLPISLIYPFLQKYFVKGVTLGSIKG
jgi:putative aldouronate transport system permease protein